LHIFHSLSWRCGLGGQLGRRLLLLLLLLGFLLGSSFLRWARQVGALNDGRRVLILVIPEQREEVLRRHGAFLLATARYTSRVFERRRRRCRLLLQHPATFSLMHHLPCGGRHFPEFPQKRAAEKHTLNSTSSRQALGDEQRPTATADHMKTNATHTHEIPTATTTSKPHALEKNTKQRRSPLLLCYPH